MKCWAKNILNAIVLSPFDFYHPDILDHFSRWTFHHHKLQHYYIQKIHSSGFISDLGLKDLAGWKCEDVIHTEVCKTQFDESSVKRDEGKQKLLVFHVYEI